MTNATHWPRLAIAATVLLLLGGCGDGPKNGEAGPSVADPSTATTTCDTTTATATATAVAVPGALPESLRPPAADTVQQADVQAGGDVVLIVSSPAEVDDVYRRYKTALPTAGFTVDREDNEGREAELYFSKNGQKGSLLIKMSSCPPGSTAYQLTVPTA